MPPGSVRSGPEVKYTKLQRLGLYESLLHRLQFASAVTMRSDEVYDLLELIGDWSYAHRAGNGERTEREQQAAIDKALAAIETYLKGSG